MIRSTGTRILALLFATVWVAFAGFAQDNKSTPKSTATGGPDQTLTIRKHGVYF